MENAWFRGVPLAPATDISPLTPDFSPLQRYWDATVGINLRSLWSSHPETKGAGFSYVDIENAWKLPHEDFPTLGDLRTFTRPQLTPDHGTGVVGILSAAHLVDARQYGVQGGVPDATPYIWDDHNYIANTLFSPLFQGDMLLLEVAFDFDPKGLCSVTPFAPAVPLERDDNFFAQIKLMTGSGVTVVQPAGNDSQNLDHSCYGGELSRGGRDSGAIFVGAMRGTFCLDDPNPLTPFQRATFSSYGSRIDASSWGECVRTTGGKNGVPDLYDPGDFRQWYTYTFGGTSSAAPIVGAGAMALQAYQFWRSTFLSPLHIRRLLQRFGTPVPNIARQPDVGAAVAWLNSDDDSDGMTNGEELSYGLARTKEIDLDGDGASDVLYRNVATGGIWRMLMSGLSATDANTSYIEPNLDYLVVGTGDFDGDAISDVLWRQTSTGNLFIQYYNVNGFPAPVIPTPYVEPNTAWRIVGTTDLDGDRKSDILWWNQSTGQVYAVLMDSAAIRLQGYVTTISDTNWKPVAVGDLSGSGTANQVVWRNYATGYVALMTITNNGVSFSQTNVPLYYEPNLSWRLIALPDLNGDGKSDMLWRHVGTGEIWGQVMNGTTITSQGSIHTEPDLNWEVVAVGDYNKDGKHDILWRHESDGRVHMQLMNGLLIGSQATIYTEPNLNWSVLGFWEFGKANSLFP